MSTVYIVTISEIDAAKANTVDVEAFADKVAAEHWIDNQIAAKVAALDLPSSAVDGWYVELDGPTHTIQYDVKDRGLKER